MRDEEARRLEWVENELGMVLTDWQRRVLALPPEDLERLRQEWRCVSTARCDDCNAPVRWTANPATLRADLDMLDPTAWVATVPCWKAECRGVVTITVGTLRRAA